MINILHSKDLLSIDSISNAKNNTVAILIVFSIGVIITIAGTHITSNKYINYSLGLIGFIIAIIAIGNLFAPTQELVRKDSNEKLQKRTLYFNIKNLNKIEKLLETGDITTLRTMEIETGQILVVLYTNATSSFYIAQIFKFIPYEYRPYTPPIIYKT